MTRRPQTEMAILGALSVMPMTGYAVRRAIQDVLGHFWSESFGQIYPTLKRLEQEGMVERRGGRSGPISLTSLGLERLRELLASPIQDAPPRNGMLLRLFFGRHLGPGPCREIVEQVRVEAVERLAGFEAIRGEIAGEVGTAADHPYWLITVSAGEHAYQATIAWAEETLDALDALEAG